MALTGDSASLVGILSWAQSSGVDVAELTVGMVSIKLRPAVVAGGTEERDGAQTTGRTSIHEEFGGELFQRAMAEKVIGADLQPAIGRRTG